MADNEDEYFGEIPESEPKETVDALPDTSFLERFKRAVNDNHFYQQIVREPIRRAVIFFLQIILIATILHSGFVLYRAIPQANQVFTRVKQQIPSIHWQDGGLHVEADVPYRLTIEDGMVVIIDPAAELNRSRLESDVVAVLTNGGLYYRYTDGKFEFQSSQDQFGKEWTLNSKTMENYRNTLLILFGIVTIGASGLLQLLTQAFRVLLIASGGWLLTQSRPDGFDRGQLIKISIHLLAPIFLLDWALQLVGLPIAAPAGIYEIALLCLGSYWIYRIYTKEFADDPNSAGKS